MSACKDDDQAAAHLTTKAAWDQKDVIDVGWESSAMGQAVAKGF